MQSELCFQWVSQKSELNIRIPNLAPPPQWRCNRSKGERQVKAKATQRTMVMGTRVASKNEGNGNSNKGGGQATAMRAMVAATTVVGKDEGGGDSNECGG
jgi:hypothetical protein